MDNAPVMEALSPVRREILETSEKWTEAIVANDAEAIGRFMSDDWIMVSNRGICTKQDFLGFVGSGELTHDSMELADLGRISIYGDTATMAARVTNIAHFGGQTFHANEWTSDVFRKTDGEWKCVLTHITPVAEIEVT